MLRATFLLVTSLFLGLSTAAEEVVSLRNWTAPPYWVPPSDLHDGAPALDRAGRAPAGKDSEPPQPQVAPAALPFFAITPCRLADTRPAGGLSGPYGPPFMNAAVPRDFPMTGGACGIPANAAAVSMTLSVTDTAGPGFLRCYPQGGSAPLVAALTFEHVNQTISNAAILPLGTGGGITVIPGVSGTDLIIDVNGYYAAQGVVTSVTSGASTLQGDVTLSAGSNVTITPSGQTLTIAATGGAGGSLPAGSANQTLRNDGTSWVTNGALTSDGTNVTVGGVLNLPATPSMQAGSNRLLTVDLTRNSLFFGPAAGGSATTGVHNTAFGHFALDSAAAGAHNTAVGAEALLSTDTGSRNTAVGDNALASNAGGNQNSALGSSALQGNVTGSDNTAVGTASLSSNGSGGSNTAVGSASLISATGNGNTAVGVNALSNNVAGSFNVALGYDAGFNETGSNRLYIANSSVDPPLVYGEFENKRVGINTKTLASTLEVGGSMRAVVSAGVAVSGYGSTGALAGVYGESNAATTTGVWGYSTAGTGVTGFSVNLVGVSGVTGTSSQPVSFIGGAGVWGDSAGQTGVYGTSGTGTGVVGFSTSGDGLHGGGATGVYGSGTSTGVHGVSTPSSFNVLGAGVWGDSSSKPGVEGTSGTSIGVAGISSSLIGVYGSTVPGSGVGTAYVGSAGVWGDASSGVGVYGTSLGNAALAGVCAPGYTSSCRAAILNGKVQNDQLTGFVNHPVYADASGVLTNASSDGRLKKNVRPLSDEIDVFAVLSGLRGVAFDWDTSISRAANLGSRREIGFIAQEVETVLPHVVDEGGDGYKSVDYAKLTPLLVEAIKAQQAEIRDLTEKVETGRVQERRIRDLEARLLALESR